MGWRPKCDWPYWVEVVTGWRPGGRPWQHIKGAGDPWGRSGMDSVEYEAGRSAH